MKWFVAISLLALFVAGCGGGDNAAPVNNTADGDTPTQTTTKQEPDARQKHRAQEFYKQAQLNGANNDNTGAVDLFIQAIELDPEYKEAHANLARVLNELGRYTEAYDHFLRASELEPGTEAKRFFTRKAAEACRANANEAINAGEYKLAEEHIRDMHKLVPQSAETMMLLGRAQFNRDAFKQARESYALASDIALGDQRREALFYVGQCDYSLEDYAAAAEQFSTIINEAYSAHDVYGYRGYCRYKLNDFEGAISDFQQAQRFATSDDKRREYIEVEVTLARAMDSDD